jgi:hypothetical protein
MFSKFMFRFAKFRISVGMLVAAVGVVLLRLYDPATSGIFPPCPVHYLTGWYCPGCGSLRALHALLHGDLLQAWAMNPLTVMLLPFLTYGLISEVLLRTRGLRLPEPALSAGHIRALFAVIVLFGVVRNLPMQPFAGLAPGVMHW